MTKIAFAEHQALARQLVMLHRSGSLPHAILLSSASGLGLDAVAHAVGTSLLCDANEEWACTRCRGCELVAAGSHGDYRWVSPGEGKTGIGVEQVRLAIDFMSKTSAYGSQKVLVFSGADRMSSAAANALLKTLEEPPGNSVIILLADRAWFLPATIRSRCQSWRLPPLSESACRSYIREHGLIPPEDDQTTRRSLERLVVDHATGRADSNEQVALAICDILDAGGSSDELSRTLQQNELTEGIQAVLLVLEERLRSQLYGNSSVLALLHLHRVVATLLQRIRGGAIPAKETACYEVANLVVQAARNQLAELQRGLDVVGA